MEWVLVVIIAILVIRDLVREYQWQEREIDLVDRALPRSEKEHRDLSVSHRLKGLGKKGGRRKKNTTTDDEKAGGGPGPQPPTKLW